MQPSTFFMFFISNAEANKELPTERHILSTEVECSNFVDYNRGQVFSDNKYFFLFTYSQDWTSNLQTISFWSTLI